MPRPSKPKPPAKVSFVSLKYCSTGLTSEQIAEYAEHYYSTIRARTDLADDCRIFLHTYEDADDEQMYSNYHVVATRDTDSLNIWLARDLLPPLFKLRREVISRNKAEHKGG